MILIQIYKHIRFYLFVLIVGISAAEARQMKGGYDEQDLTSLLLKNEANIVVTVEPLSEMVVSMTHGVVKPKVLYFNFNAIHQALNAQQREILQKADVIIRVGKGLEPLLDNYIEQQGPQFKNKIITLSNYIPSLEKENIRFRPSGVIFAQR